MSKFDTTGINAVVIDTNGGVTEKTLTFEQIQKEVGGYVELVHIANTVFMYVNEDGIGLGLPDNPLALTICRVLGSNVLVDRCIRGPMVVVGTNGDRNLSPANVKMVVGLAARIRRKEQNAGA